MNKLSPELNRILKHLEKENGAGFISVGPKYEIAKPISTGSARLDAATTLGGLPKGRIIEIFGPESSGKTSFALWMLAQYRRQFPEDERPAVIWDVERSIAAPFMKDLGVDPDSVIFVIPETAEQALQSVVDLIGSGEISFGIFDSVDGIQNAAFLAKKIGDADMKGIAKEMGQMLRQVKNSVVAFDTTMIFINQTRDSMDMYKPGPVTSGGKALKFYTGMRLETKEQKPSKEVPGAFQFKVKLKKNKFGPPGHEDVIIDFIYAKGPDPLQDLISFAKDLGLVRYAGTSVFARTGENSTEEKIASGGAAGFRAALLADATLVTKIRDLCLRTHVPVEAAADPVEDPESPDEPS